MENSIEIIDFIANNMTLIGVFIWIFLVFFLIISHFFSSNDAAHDQYIKERYRLLVDWGAQGHFDHDVATGRMWLSDQAHALLGEPVGSLNGVRTILYSRAHPVDRILYDNTVAEIIRQRADRITLTLRLRHADGHWVWVEICGRIVYGPDHRVIRSAGSLSDVSDLYESHQDLMAAKAELEARVIERTCHLEREIAERLGAEQRLKEAIDAMPAGVVLFDADLRLRVRNRRILRDHWPGNRDEVQPGIHLRDFVRLYWTGMRDSGTMPDLDVAAMVDIRLDALLNNEATEIESQTWDDRIVRILGAEIQGGGLIIVQQDITRLRAAEADLSDLIEALPVGIMVFDAEDHLLLRNGASKEIEAQNAERDTEQNSRQDAQPAGFLSGTIPAIEREDRVRHILAALGRGPATMPPDDGQVQGWMNRTPTAMRTGTVRHLPDGRYLRDDIQELPNGKLLVVQLDVTAMKQAETDAQARAAALEQAVQIQRQAELAIRAGETKLNRIIDALPVGVVVYDTDGRVAVRNRMLNTLFPVPNPAAMIGLDRVQHVVETLRQVSSLSHLDEPALAAYARQWMQNDSSDGRETRLDNGKTVLRRTITLEDGLAIAIFLDVTPVRRAEQRLRDAVDSMDCGIQLFDAGGRLMIWNAATLAIFPDLKDRLKSGQAYDGLAPLLDCEQVNCALPNAPDASPVRHCVLDDGRVLLTRHLTTKEGGLLLMQTDVTELRRAQDELARSDRLTALGLLVAGIAHEVNTPVGVALTAGSHLDVASRQIRADLATGQIKRSSLDRFIHEAVEAADIIVHNLSRTSDLISGFKQISVDQVSEERRTIDLADYLTSILASLAPQLRKTRHQVAIACPRGIALDTYPGVLSQIITNFVMNSLMHGFPDDRAGRITIEAVPDGGRVRLSYRDDGAGVRPDHLSRIFEPFFTTKRGRGGSGLGLSIVHNLVTGKLAGTLAAANAPTGGLILTITMPCQSPVLSLTPDPLGAEDAGDERGAAA